MADASSTEQTQTDRVDRVRSVFDRRENYLNKRQLDIRLRTETVNTLIGSKTYSNILDIGCGDGSVSVPLLNPNTNLTLLDISKEMLSFARERVPDNLQSHVKFLNQDFMEAHFDKPFDLIICLGVLAHVASPPAIIAKIFSVLEPGGTLMLECTDGFQILGRINRLYNHAVWLFRPPKYRLNVLSAREVLRTAENQGLKSTAIFRYGLPLPGMGRFFSHDGIYRLTRSMFGDVTVNRNRWLGNQYIFCLVRPPNN